MSRRVAYGSTAIIAGILGIGAMTSHPGDTSRTSIDPAATRATSTTSTSSGQSAAETPPDPRYCVENVTLEAFVGDPMSKTLWSNLGQSEASLRKWCLDYLASDPEASERMHAETLAIQRFLAATTTTAPRSADALEVAACVDVVVWGSLAGDPDAREIWSSVGESKSELRNLCNATLLDNPEMGPNFVAKKAEIQAFLSAPPPTNATVVGNGGGKDNGGGSGGGGCDPNYSGCVPIDSDVDCASGSGNGPSYVAGPVQVIGSDIYGLDGNGDGWGCE